MKTTVPWLALLLAGFAVPAVHADPGYPYPPPMPPPGWPCPVCTRPAPDACGPGYYCQGRCGAVYGPNYCLRPCFEPFNGFVPCQSGGPYGAVCPQARGALPGIPPPPHYGFEPPRPHVALPPPANPGLLNSPVFPTHPYAHGPRDYFMQE